MRSEPVWVTAKAVIRANQRSVADTGEPFFIRDQGLLESALARPRNLWAYGENDLATLAVAVMLGVARNHPFGQGNKRAAFAAAEYFLFLNGWEFTAPDRAALADRVVDLITGALEEDEFVEMIRGQARRL
ncbi:MAG TPA: type II toxin-antitoxin system death-on-curing family toxin [Allosphingosinicella sp.]|nr:type II toxin-antitoxin system death-on-curing family toxin [Allosphingosinicella sp.]